MKVEKAFILTEEETSIINDIMWELFENAINTPMEIGDFFLNIKTISDDGGNKFSFKNKYTVFLNEEEE